MVYIDDAILEMMTSNLKFCSIILKLNARRFIRIKVNEKYHEILLKSYYYFPTKLQKNLLSIQKYN